MIRLKGMFSSSFWVSYSLCFLKWTVRNLNNNWKNMAMWMLSWVPGYVESGRDTWACVQERQLLGKLTLPVHLPSFPFTSQSKHLRGGANRLHFNCQFQLVSGGFLEHLAEKKRFWGPGGMQKGTERLVSIAVREYTL